MRILEDLRDMFRENPQQVDGRWLHEERQARELAEEPSRYGEEHRQAVRAMVMGDPEPMKRFRARFDAKRGGSKVHAFTRVVGER